MTNEEALEVIKQDIPCEQDFDLIEALTMAIKALETIPKYKDAYNKGWNDGAKATYEHLKMCEEEQGGDLISRQAVIDAIEDDNRNGHYSCFASNNDAQCFKDVIRSLPSVNPQEPKTGHWIEEDMTYCGVDLINYKCDKCGKIGGAWRKGLKPNQLPKYCQWCGARMESENT